MSPTAPTEKNAAPPRQGMFRDMLYVHTKLRRDVESVRCLAAEARDGHSAATIRDEIRNLQTNSPLRRLKFGCLYACCFVHTHHTIEDAAVFPMIRRQDPLLNRVSDRLAEDHLTVHHITGCIAGVAGRVAVDASGVSRFELVSALTGLEEHLLTHLDLEESSIGPLLSTWERWPAE